jgi:hypothetical protein
MRSARHASITRCQRIGPAPSLSPSSSVGGLPKTSCSACGRLCGDHRPPESLLGVGHKAQGELLSHEALHQTFRIRKVFLPATGPAIRQRVCEVECPADRARARGVPRFGRQCSSSASQTGRQYWAVDSITTPSTSRSTSQSVSALVHVNSCDSVRHQPLRESGERASSHWSGSRAIVGFTQAAMTPTLRIKQLLGLDGSAGSIRSRRSRRRHSDLRRI